MSKVRESPLLPLWTMPIWLIVVAVMLFVGLGVVAHGPGMIEADVSILRWSQEAPTNPSQTIADIGNLLGETATIPIALIVLAALSMVRTSVPAAVFCLSLLGFRIIGMFLKLMFDSPRPEEPIAELKGLYDGAGFPSGHAQTATVVAAATTIVVSHLFPRSRFAMPIIVVIWFWAAACGFARIWYGAHWPSDVLGGFLIAIVWVGLSTRIAYAVRWNPSRRSLP